MSCKHPMIRVFRWKDHSETIKVFSTKNYEVYHENTPYRMDNGGNTREWLNKPMIGNKYIGYEKIPCGKCIGCRLDYSKEWATRCTLEAKKYEQNYFLTLTYSPENLPMQSPWFDPETGERIEQDINTGTLEPYHITEFIKKLRRHWKYHYNHEGIRFYCCGEYGEQKGRPHYHMIIFNLPIRPESLKPFFINREYQQIYLCDEIEKIWGKGLISIGEVTWSSCAYVARYMTKKQKGPGSAAEYARTGREPEFARMSRMPGIGKEYFDHHKAEIFTNDEIILPAGGGKVKSVKPPKYYDRLYDLDNPEAMAAIKEKRKTAAIEAEKVKMQKSTRRMAEVLAAEERALQQKTKLLKRGLPEE